MLMVETFKGRDEYIKKLIPAVNMKFTEVNTADLMGAGVTARSKTYVFDNKDVT